jgi:hypothetical protein
MSRKLIRLNATAVCHVLLAFREGPCTAKELSEQSGLHLCTMRRYLQEMRKHNLVHIAEWEGRWPVYEMTPGKDKPRPITPKAVIQARYRQRKAIRLMRRESSPWAI